MGIHPGPVGKQGPPTHTCPCKQCLTDYIGFCLQFFGWSKIAKSTKICPHVKHSKHQYLCLQTMLGEILLTFINILHFFSWFRVITKYNAQLYKYKNWMSLLCCSEDDKQREGLQVTSGHTRGGWFRRSFNEWGDKHYHGS